MSILQDDALVCELFEELEQIGTVDAHEHLPTEESVLKEDKDFFTLFKHYCRGDLVSAGATEEDIAFLEDHNQPLNDRWERFKPFLSAIRTGGYARSALIVVREILGLDDLNDDTHEAVGEKLREMTSFRMCFKPIPMLIGELNAQLNGWSNYFCQGYPRMAFRKINRYVRERLHRHLSRRSQRPWRPPKETTYYQRFAKMGLVYL